MQFVLIQPGTILIGKFEPVCPSPNPPSGSRQGSGAPSPSAGTRGQGAAAGRGAGRPADPRRQWGPADYKLCEELAKQDSMPGFTARIDRPFYIGKYEVTQAEWKKVMAKNPSVFQGSKVKDEADRHPVDSVTWQDTQAFLKKLNAMEKTKVYRLPTEFEWEYSGRAGAPSETTWAQSRELAWIMDNNKGTTHIVGTKKPNAWGLHDMLGNVWEWVQDYYNEKIFADPKPPRKGTEHVLKGASFLGDVKNAIYATHGAGPGNKFDVGFRIVREVK
jgi:formylglycine-generating enzyme required for sulfatase activity